MDTDDIAEALIARLSAPLAPADRCAFRDAAERALTSPGCWGPGSAYRTVAQLWRGFLHPPFDDSDRHSGAREFRRPTKLTEREPLA